LQRPEGYASNDLADDEVGDQIKLLNIDKYNKKLEIIKTTMKTCEAYYKAQEQKKKVPVHVSTEDNKNKKTKKQQKKESYQEEGTEN
jgi:hypothetical protein